MLAQMVRCVCLLSHKNAILLHKKEPCGRKKKEPQVAKVCDSFRAPVRWPWGDKLSDGSSIVVARWKITVGASDSKFERPKEKNCLNVLSIAPSRLVKQREDCSPRKSSEHQT
jgi:hypothetical protein